MPLSPLLSSGHSRRLAAPPLTEVGGVPDGPDVVLASGVRIRRLRTAGRAVTPEQLAQAIRGVQLLPLPHQRLLARTGIAVELVPVPQLEGAPGMTHPMIGATAVTQAVDGSWVPTRLRIATASPLAASSSANTIAEVTQHEIGHVLAVLAHQDRSEAAATRYAARY